MPAAAVIPAPIAYIKVVAVKRLVVELMTLCAWPVVLHNAVTGVRVILLEIASDLNRLVA